MLPWLRYYMMRPTIHLRTSTPPRCRGAALMQMRCHGISDTVRVPMVEGIGRLCTLHGFAWLVATVERAVEETGFRIVGQLYWPFVRLAFDARPRVQSPCLFCLALAVLRLWDSLGAGL